MKSMLAFPVLVSLLSGCAVNPDLVSTGPQFDNMIVGSQSGQAHEVICRGVFESSDVCVQKAREICEGKAVHRLNPEQFGEDYPGASEDPHLLVFRCGDNPPVAQAQVAPPPPPAVVQSVAPVLPLRPVERVLINADALFEFNRGDVGGITGGGRKKLHDLARRLNGLSPEEIRITGYTDRIGTDPYNLSLSMRRADSIRAYLQSEGVRAAMKTQGLGKKIPGMVCPDRKDAKLVACLAPDRVVVIEVLVRDTGAPGTGGAVHQ